MKDQTDNREDVLVANAIKQSKYQRELVMWTRISGTITVTLIICKIVAMM